MEHKVTTQQLSLFEPVKIVLSQGHIALVDPIDGDLAALKWFSHRGGDNTHVYAARHSAPGCSNIRLHRIVMARIAGRPLLDNEKVDHIDGNTLDNRRSNLRIATSLENARNSSKKSRNSSGYKGVYWDSANSKWRAEICVNRQKKALGRFIDIEDARAAYEKAAKEFHGEFARFD